MSNPSQLKTITSLFEGKTIRSLWDANQEDYYFSVVDICSALSESKIPRNYWNDLKRKLKAEGSQLHEKIVQLKMRAQDGKIRVTDTLDTAGIFRLIESIPSPKAEPLKLWLAKLGTKNKWLASAIQQWRPLVYSPSLSKLPFHVNNLYLAILCYHKYSFCTPIISRLLIYLSYGLLGSNANSI